MIKNDEQLQVVREQLATAEAALDSLHREVRPQNRNMYDLMSESYIEMILQLRGQVDSYLGITAIPETADLVISLEGDRVGLGHTSAASVTQIIDKFRRGLQSTVELLKTGPRVDATRRRRPRWIEKACNLPFVGVTSGSVRILLGEPECESLLSQEEKESFGEALDLIFDGLTWADVDNPESPEHPFAKRSEPTRQSMLGVISNLLPAKTGPIERIGFQRRGSDGPEARFTSAFLTRDSRERIHRELEALASDTEYVELEGVIRIVDLDAQTFVLRERLNEEPDLDCEYGPELEDAVKEYLDCRVTVAGSLEISRKTRKSKMSVDAIELVSKDDDGEQEEETNE